MDSIVLKKRLSSYRTDEGRLIKVGDEVLIDILRAWESWTGTSKEFYQSLGLSKQQLAIMIKKGKKLSKSRIFAGGEFKEIKLDSLVSGASTIVGAIELMWDQGKVIRFSQVDQLIDFLKKVA